MKQSMMTLLTHEGAGPKSTDIYRRLQVRREILNRATKREATCTCNFTYKSSYTKASGKNEKLGICVCSRR